MAQEPRAPWSRWDVPGYRYVPQHVIQPIANRQFDSPTYVLPQPGAPAPNIADATLLDQRVNDDDPSFFDCIYGIPNTMEQVVQQCYVDLGCCNGGCCENWSWKEKYGAAVALICIFCAIVILAFVIWLVIWLINRSRDKAQRATLESQMSTPSPQPLYAQSPPQTGYPY